MRYEKTELEGRRTGSQVVFGHDRTYGRYFQYVIHDKPVIDEDKLSQGELVALVQKYAKSSSAYERAMENLLVESTGGKVASSRTIEKVAAIFGLSLEDSEKLLLYREARFSEGEKGRKEFQKWLKEQPKDFQDEWEKQNELNKDRFEESLMEKNGPAALIEEIEEAVKRSNSYVSDEVLEVAEESSYGEEVFSRMAALFSEDSAQSAARKKAAEKPPSKLRKIEIVVGTGSMSKVIKVRGNSFSDAKKLSDLLEKAFRGDDRAKDQLQKKYKLSPGDVESAVVYIEGHDDEPGAGWNDGHPGGFQRLATKKMVEMVRNAFVPDTVDGWLEWEDGSRTATEKTS